MDHEELTEIVTHVEPGPIFTLRIGVWFRPRRSSPWGIAVEELSKNCAFLV